MRGTINARDIVSICNDSAIWIASCLRLLNSVKVLQRGLKGASDIEQFDAGPSAMMLVGYAFENAFKARFLKQGGLLYCDGKQTGFRRHEFTKWVREHKIHVSDWEAEALDKAEFICGGWGRYPFHNKDERRSESWGWTDVEQIKNVVQRLLEESKS